MEKPKISIVVAAYNVEDYIEKCLESLTAQSIKEIEILVINDGSRDNTVNIANEFTKCDKRIRVISQENGGLSAARNTGINHANGEFIAFVDGDDYLDKSMYEILYEKTITDNLDLVVCGFKKVWLDEDANKLREKEYYFNKELLNGNVLENFLCKHDEPFVVAWNKLYRTEIIKKNNIYFENRAFFEDVGFMPRYLYYANKVACLDNAMYYYVQRKGSITKSYNSMIESSLINTLRLVKEFFKKDISLRPCIDTLELRLKIYHLNYLIDNKKDIKAIRQEIIGNEKLAGNLPFKHKVSIFLLKNNMYEFIYKNIWGKFNEK
ncbi:MULTISPECIES: glycosyltransferase [unclassified Bacillus cereus group]|uniref:glycosyltransferase family 2 protein n=1 Tax=unclassified Bacillus cereus group TaxID=2750818 RepID=UPI0024C763E4|nr:MAG: glycosyltransferase [Bacillus paranthracis]WAI33341.1 MAG: glycosyltransferase [Bacillus paranthracis]WAI38524.1 MAG: glycosyltransferase [Bacillus paranthracis]